MKSEGAPGWLSWMAAPLNTLPARHRWALASGLTAITAAVAGLGQRGLGSPFGQPDASFYLAMARGHAGAVGQPFASRPLAPLLARTIAAAGHVAPETGFLVLGWASLLFVLWTVFTLATRTAAPRWFPLAMAAVPFWPQLLHGLALPDLPYAALLACLLWCLATERPTLAAFTMFPLMVARESTMLVLLCLLAVGWRRLRVGGCVLAVLAAGAGSILVKHLTAGAAGNVEHLPAAVYLAAKLPWNLLRTLGIDPWSNLYPYLCAVPLRQYAVHLGPLHSVGVCGFSVLWPSFAAAALLTTFGVLPVLCLRLSHRGVLARAGLLERFCLLYGGVSFVLAPVLGTGQARLFGYAWPLWLVAVPALFRAVQAGEAAQPHAGYGAQSNAGDASQRRGAARLVAVLSFLLLHIAFWQLASLFPSPRVLLAEVGLHLAAAILLWSPVGRGLRLSQTG